MSQKGFVSLGLIIALLAIISIGALIHTLQYKDANKNISTSSLPSKASSEGSLNPSANPNAYKEQDRTIVPCFLYIKIPSYW